MVTYSDYSEEDMKKSMTAFKEERFDDVIVPLRILRLYRPAEFRKQAALQIRRCNSHDYGRNPKNKEKIKKYNEEYYQRPEVKARRKTYSLDPEVIKRRKANFKRYYDSPEGQAVLKAHRELPEVKAKKKESDRISKVVNILYTKHIKGNSPAGRASAFSSIYEQLTAKTD